MCTAVTYKTKDFYFGRTLDYEYSYKEEVTITPRNYEFKFRNEETISSHYAIIGMAYVADKYPLYYDAINEKGLGIAGLNFVGNAHYNEEQKGPGFARQCGLNHAKGKYCVCIDSDTMYPPLYITTMTKALQQKGVMAAYALWSFLPDKHYSQTGLFFYEKLRDVYFNIQHLRRPELNVRGMVFAFQTDTAHKVGFRTDIIRGEDGSLALGLKKYGKIKFVRSRKARAVTGYGTISADGSLFNSFWKRTVKGINNFTSLFHYKEKYEDEDSNLIK